jgi:hypothetical protein
MTAAWVVARRSGRNSVFESRSSCSLRMARCLLRSVALRSRSSKYSLLKQAPANPMPHTINANKMSSKFMFARIFERLKRR